MDPTIRNVRESLNSPKMATQRTNRRQTQVDEGYVIDVYIGATYQRNALSPSALFKAKEGRGPSEHADMEEGRVQR